MEGNTVNKREQLLEQQRQLHLLFSAWFADKKQREILTYRKPNGDLVEHHPDGTEKVIQYAKYTK